MMPVAENSLSFFPVFFFAYDLLQINNEGFKFLYQMCAHYEADIKN